MLLPSRSSTRLAAFASGLSASALFALAPSAAEMAPLGYSTPPATASAIDGQLRAQADASVPVSCSQAWAVFTDFDGMARFLPGIQTSHAAFSSPSKALLTQRGSFHYGIFFKSYSSTRTVTLNAPESVESVSVSTDEVPIWSSTTFVPQPNGGCAVKYSTQVGLPGWMPEFAAVAFSKSMAGVQMKAMLAEIQRRYAEPPLPDPPPASR